VNITIMAPQMDILLTAPALLSEGFSFQFNTMIGSSYVVEGSVSQGAPAPFMPLATNVADAGVMTFVDPAANSRANRVYRVFRQP
jgi:hypothetical protein